MRKELFVKDIQLLFRMVRNIALNGKNNGSTNEIWITKYLIPFVEHSYCQYQLGQTMLSIGTACGLGRLGGHQLE